MSLNIASFLIHALGASALVPLVEGIAVGELQGHGDAELTRIGTIPHGTLVAIAAHTGADMGRVEAANRAHAAAFAALVESFAPASVASADAPAAVQPGG